jgi:signal transduction histidine kinase
MAPKAENKQKAADAVEQDNDKRRMAAADGKAAPGSKGAVGDKDAASDKAGAGVAGEAAKIGQDVLAAKDQRGTNDQLHLAMRKRADEEGKPFFQRLADHVSDKERSNAMQDQVRKLRAAEERGLKPARETDRAVPPPGTNPPAPAQDNGGPANPFDANPTNPAAATPAPPIAVHLGSMRPKWVVGRDGSEVLVLARPVQMDNKMLCQGIVLDWPKLEAALKDEVKEFFPEAQLIPIKDPAAASPDRVMTALPVQLDPGPQPELPPAGLTTLRLGLLLAWAAAIIAFSAVGFCGWTLIDLAERRIRFVSAVTHELRTPLTSLRLYLDMLVSGMIQDEAKRQEYLNTLATESDRLHRLIDNVLDFARLEKRRTNSDVKPVSVISLVGQLRDTWTDRLAREERELVVISTLPDGQEVKTDAAMVQQIVGNLIDNARKYSRDAGDKRIWLWARPGGRTCVIIEVEDRGPGIPPNERRMIFKPFRRGGHADNTSGGAGLGLALAKSWAEVLGGKLTYRPADGGTGACFRLELPVG